MHTQDHFQDLINRAPNGKIKGEDQFQIFCAIELNIYLSEIHKIQPIIAHMQSYFLARERVKCQKLDEIWFKGLLKLH